MHSYILLTTMPQFELMQTDCTGHPSPKKKKLKAIKEKNPIAKIHKVKIQNTKHIIHIFLHLFNLYETVLYLTIKVTIINQILNI